MNTNGGEQNPAASASGSLNVGAAPSVGRMKSVKKSSHIQPEIKPVHVKNLETVLEKQGVEYYEKNVVNQLLEFMSYYSTEMLSEANVLCEFAGKSEIEYSDLKLAIEFKEKTAFTRPLPLEFIKEIAS